MNISDSSSGSSVEKPTRKKLNLNAQSSGEDEDGGDYDDDFEQMQKLKETFKKITGKGSRNAKVEKVKKLKQKQQKERESNVLTRVIKLQQ